MGSPLEKEVAVEVQPIQPTHAASSVQSTSDVESQVVDDAWKPGFWSQFPWYGVSALLVVIMGSIGSFLVLHFADQKPASEFLDGRVAPNVLLTIFNNLSNLAITFAVGQGVAINWWRRAMNGGTVKQLHYSWSFSTGIANIFTKFKYFNMIALAVLMAKIAIVDGILYQQAVSTYIGIIRDLNHNDTISLFGAKIFPITGTMGPDKDSYGLMDYTYEALTYHWDDTRLDIDTLAVVDNCRGEDCHFSMNAAGFALSCTDQTTQIDYGRTGPEAARRNLTNGTAIRAGYTDLPLFSVNFSRIWPSPAKNYSALQLDIIYTESLLEHSKSLLNGSCPMNLVHRTCELRPAELTYKLQYTNGSSIALSQQRHKTAGLFGSNSKTTANSNNSNSLTTPGLTATLNSNPDGIRLDYDCPANETDPEAFVDSCTEYDAALNQVRGVGFVRYLDIVETFEPRKNSSLEGIYIAFQTALQSSSKISYINNSWIMTEDGVIAMYMRNENPTIGTCAYGFSNPFSEVMKLVNIMTLMTSQQDFLYYGYNEHDGSPTPKYAFDQSMADRQNITAIVHYQDIYYNSSYLFMWIAIALSIAVVLCIAPVFWGWWELGRKVTLGPFEIANAFQGPALAGVRGDHIEEVLKSVGRQKVVYGQVEHETGQKLGFKIA